MNERMAAARSTVALVGQILVACAFFGVIGHASGQPSAAPDPRPNIFFAIADDWSWPHAGAYGDTVIKTPTFDRVAREGVLFANAFCAAASCTPSRASVLTGQWPHRLESGANLWSILPAKYAVYPDLLEAQGYFVGYMGKGWAPGALGDRPRNPAGPMFKNFAQFLKAVPPGKPWCFWYGSHDPHRPYIPGQGTGGGIKLDDIKVPAFLPDVPDVRSDIADYYFAVQRYDHDTGAMIHQIEDTGQLDHTIVVMTSDNGMPFPRAKANCYEYSNHMPLAIRWGEKVKGGQTVDAIVSHVDFAPTFLEAAGQKPTPDMNGRSLLPLLLNGPEAAAAEWRGYTFIERERHANVRKGDAGYPMRGIRTRRTLYIHNFRPDLWPAGDPTYWKAVGPFGDIDAGPSKKFIMDHRAESAIADLFRAGFEKRPAEELYDLEKDPYTMNNLVADPQYAAQLAELRDQTQKWMTATSDPRATAGGSYDAFDKYPYTGPAEEMPAGRKAKGGR